LRTATAGYFSALSPLARSKLRRCVSRFPGGIVEVQPERLAPSRAFAKLAEVELRLQQPIMPGETCVDLGSSPGSWAWWALHRGASVVAVDRSPLRSDLMRRAALQFVRGDAFRYRPPQPVDWLLCDVIAFPAKTIALAERWLAEGWCRRFCITIKFRGEKEYDQLETLKERLSCCGHDFYLRRLTANRNEVMLFGQSSATVENARGGL
jgi:23S rRNA (cytidine2498-2'-O)-methyltransferase